MAKMLHPRKVPGYGWIPDLPDHRDFPYAAKPGALLKLPAAVDLRGQFTIPCYDQGELGSCTANAIAGALEFDQVAQAETPATPSRLFIYYNERVMEGTVDSDSGAMIRDGIKSAANQGACPETEWPYSDDSSADGAFRQQPPEQCYADGLQRRALAYQRIAQSVPLLKACMAEGFPFVYGFTVFESFEEPELWQNNVMPMPGPGESVLGGHAVLAVGYDDSRQVFIVRNSWGTDWGDEGYFYVPYLFLGACKSGVCERLLDGAAGDVTDLGGRA